MHFNDIKRSIFNLKKKAIQLSGKKDIMDLNLKIVIYHKIKL